VKRHLGAGQKRTKGTKMLIYRNLGPLTPLKDPESSMNTGFFKGDQGSLKGTQKGFLVSFENDDDTGGSK